MIVLFVPKDLPHDLILVSIWYLTASLPCASNKRHPSSLWLLNINSPTIAYLRSPATRRRTRLLLCQGIKSTLCLIGNSVWDWTDLSERYPSSVGDSWKRGLLVTLLIVVGGARWEARLLKEPGKQDGLIFSWVWEWAMCSLRCRCAVVVMWMLRCAKLLLIWGHFGRLNCFI
jgi:hypothetical protein